MHIVDQLASVLFEMQALNADLFRLAINIDLDFSFANDRVLELRDLIALR